MTETVLNPPSRWLKVFYRIPVMIYRLGIVGWERQVGLEWMFLTTVGRKSGKTRHTMVDVLLYDQAADTYYIEVGYGKRSDWYLNIKASSIFRAQVGRRKFTASAKELPADRNADVMVAFVHQRPKYARSVMKIVGITYTDDADLRRMASRWLLLAVHPCI